MNSTDSYSRRLKEIRQKYCSGFNEKPACLAKYQNNSLHTDFKTYDRKRDTDSSRKYRQKSVSFRDNIRPQMNIVSDLENQPPKERQTYGRDSLKKYDSQFYSRDQNKNSRDQRLRQIEQIRQSFAKSRKQTIDEWNKQVSRSRKYNRDQVPQFKGLKQRVNGVNHYDNPEFNEKVKLKDDTLPFKERNRNRFESYSHKNIKLNQEYRKDLERKYEFGQTYPNLNGEKENKLDSSFCKGHDFERENIATSIIREVDFSGQRKRKLDSETTSPIKGLMKFQSVEKQKSFSVRPKFQDQDYDWSKIDSIQQKINRVLNKNKK